MNKIDIYVCTTIFQTGVTNLPWPELLEVVDEFEASGFATMAFPTLFPWVTDGDPTVKGRKAGVTLRKGFVFNYSVLTSPLTDLTSKKLNLATFLGLLPSSIKSSSMQPRKLSDFIRSIREPSNAPPSVRCHFNFLH